jgi:hypothetical protein
MMQHNHGEVDKTSMFHKETEKMTTKLYPNWFYGLKGDMPPSAKTTTLPRTTTTTTTTTTATTTTTTTTKTTTKLPEWFLNVFFSPVTEDNMTTKAPHSAPHSALHSTLHSAPHSMKPKMTSTTTTTTTTTMKPPQMTLKTQLNVNRVVLNDESKFSAAVPIGKFLAIWALGHLGSWPFGLLAIWALGHLGSWPFGLLAIWALGHLCSWVFGHLGSWALGGGLLGHFYLGRGGGGDYGLWPWGALRD